MKIGGRNAAFDGLSMVVDRESRELEGEVAGCWGRVIPLRQSE